MNPRSVAVGRTPVASDCERDRDTFSVALGGEWGCGRCGELLAELVGEKVGYGEVDLEREVGISSVCEESVRKMVEC